MLNQLQLQEHIANQEVNKMAKSDVESKAVSYTHLDVYKRQVVY